MVIVTSSWWLWRRHSYCDVILVTDVAMVIVTLSWWLWRLARRLLVIYPSGRADNICTASISKGRVGRKACVLSYWKLIGSVPFTIGADWLSVNHTTRWLAELQSRFQLIHWASVMLHADWLSFSHASNWLVDSVTRRVDWLCVSHASSWLVELHRWEADWLSALPTCGHLAAMDGGRLVQSVIGWETFGFVNTEWQRSQKDSRARPWCQARVT